MSEPSTPEVIIKSLFKGESDSFNPLELVEPVLKNLWLIVFITVSAFILGVVFNLYSTPIYQAQSSIVIQENGQGNVIREKESDLPENAMPKYAFNTKVQIVSSRPLLDELVRRLIDKGYFEQTLEAKGYSKLDQEGKNTLIRQIAGGIKGGIAVENPRDTNLVVIKYQSPKPVMAKEVANLLAEIAVEFGYNEQMKIMKSSLVYLNQQIEDARKKLEEAEANLYDYRVKHRIFETGMDKQLVAGSRSSFSQELDRAKQEKASLQSQIKELQKMQQRQDYTKYTPLVVDNPLLLELRRKLVESEIEHDELMIKYGDRHPEVIRAAKETEILKEKFQQELNVTLTRLQYNLNVIETREELLQKSLTDIEDSAVSSTENDIGYVVLDREANSARDLYRTLLAAVKEVSVNTNGMNNNVMYVHETAVVPTKPIKPNWPLNLLLSVVLGVMLGLAFAYGREYLDMNIRHADDVKKAVNLPVLSTIPLFGSSHQSKGKGKVQAESLNRLYAATTPKSLFSESIIALRTHLNIKLPQDKPVTILVTSTAPREGKTLIASNLAVSMAMDGKKTLLIDADLHRPNVHNVLGMEKKSGLYESVVDALNPTWSELDFSKLSFGDFEHLIRLKQWSGTMKIQWDSLPSSLNISFMDGKPAGSNMQGWKEKFATPSGFPPPVNPSFTLDSSEIASVDSLEDAGKKAIEFVHQYPRLCRSTYFNDVLSKLYVTKTGIENLSLILAGTSIKNPSEVLGSEQMKILIQLVREQYDRIIIDSPPAWPLSDVGVLSRFIDGILWICRSGEIPKNMFAHNVKQVQAIQPNFFGVVINAVDLHKDRYYYYGYSPYYYNHYYKSSYYKEYMDGNGEKKKSPRPKKA